MLAHSDSEDNASDQREHREAPASRAPVNRLAFDAELVSRVVQVGGEIVFGDSSPRWRDHGGALLPRAASGHALQFAVNYQVVRRPREDSNSYRASSDERNGCLATHGILRVRTMSVASPPPNALRKSLRYKKQGILFGGAS